LEGIKHTQFNARCGRKVVRGETAGDGVAQEGCNEEDYFYTGMRQGPYWSNFGHGNGLGSHDNDDTVYENTMQYANGPADPNFKRRHQKRHGIFNHISWYWTESFINTELRTGAQDPGEWFYPYYFEGNASYGSLSFVDEPGYYNSARQEGPFIPNNPDSVLETELAQSYTMNPD